jgi:DNA-binding NarL/FixJ family response regulator
MVETKLNILLVESSAAVAKESLYILDDLEMPNEVFYTVRAEKAFNLIHSKKIDVLIWGMEYNARISSTLTELRNTGKPFSVIILSDISEEDYRKRYNSLNADYFLNKTNGLAKLVDVINELEVIIA